MSKDCTIQDVFHRFYPSFESTHSISPAQRKAAYHIMNCKTGAFGVNVSVCEDCGCMSVNIQDVAKAAKVSVSTASRKL